MIHRNLVGALFLMFCYGVFSARAEVPANYHQWNFATIGTLHFPEAGPQLLTFHYGKGNNFAYFEFEPVAAESFPKP